MIKLVFMVRRREGITREEFQRYWRQEHADLVKRHAELLRIRRYVQTHAQDTELDDALAGARGSDPRQYDGVAELWWDSIDDLVSVAASADGHAAQQALLEDERRFIDVAKSPIWLGEEITVVGARWRSSSGGGPPPRAGSNGARAVRHAPADAAAVGSHR